MGLLLFGKMALTVGLTILQINMFEHIKNYFYYFFNKNTMPICKTYACGSRWWYANGQLHRQDGPALEYPDGSKIWYKNGKCHRLDGPAAEYADGGKEWWVNGKRHREDGPAIIWQDGTEEWWIDGNYIPSYKLCLKNERVK